MVQIAVTPDEMLVDEQFHVTVTGLNSSDKITIHAETTEGTSSFSAVGCYIAGENGIVICNKNPSLGGTYIGLDAMGLIWSIVQSPGQRLGLRFMKRNVTLPQILKFKVYMGFHSLQEIFSYPPKVLASKTIKRWYLAKGVKRVSIRVGRIRGTLFIPQGSGPFPAVIDLFGNIGGLVEFKASMLASHGIMALALAYFQHDDLPKDCSSIDIDYFKEAVTFLLHHSMCSPGGIGVIGVSLGGEIAQVLGMHCPMVKAIVVINGGTFVTNVEYHVAGTVIKAATEDMGDLEKLQRTPKGVILRWMFPSTSVNAFKVHNSQAKFLFIVGMDDQLLPPETTWLPYLKCPVDQRHRISIVSYPGAGHLIEVPYAPLNHATFNKILGESMVFGGNAVEHNMAQEDSWKRILLFFHNNLQCISTAMPSKQSKL